MLIEVERFAVCIAIATDGTDKTYDACLEYYSRSLVSRSLSLALIAIPLTGRRVVVLPAAKRRLINPSRTVSGGIFVHNCLHGFYISATN